MTHFTHPSLSLSILSTQVCVLSLFSKQHKHMLTTMGVCCLFVFGGKGAHHRFIIPYQGRISRRLLVIVWFEATGDSPVRSYLAGNAGSRPISEAKQPWACLVLGWGTTGEAHVLYSNQPHTHSQGLSLGGP